MINITLCGHSVVAYRLRHQADGSRLAIAVLERGEDFVVCSMTDETLAHNEWFSGYYTRDINRAMAEFVRRAELNPLAMEA